MIIIGLKKFELEANVEQFLSFHAADLVCRQGSN